MITLIIIIIAAIALYLYGIRNNKYWVKRGVTCEKPLPFFGNNFQGYLLRRSITQIADEFYWKYTNERVVGFLRGMTPELLVRDPEIAKRVLITDFQYFYPRGLLSSKKVIEPLLRNLFTADGDMWKLIRQRMTPAFTSGKLKAMFPLIVERAEKLKIRVLTAAYEGRALDARDLMARYTTDCIGACGFGVDSDSLNEEDSAFRKLGVKIFQVRPRDMFCAMLKEFFPNLMKNLRILSDLEDELKLFMDEVMKKRNYKISGRGDFVDLLLECKNKGTIVGESIETVKQNGMPEVATLEFDDDIIVAQLFIFFAAGFETSSSATSFTLHQLAFHPEVQKKAQAEIDTVLAKYDNKLCYDAIKDMIYLEMVFKEGLRMFPSLGFLIREAAKPYTFPGLNLSIDRGVKVLIPIQAYQTDPEYFEHPQEFRPERFHPEFNVKNKYVYMPFGEGPRACIGERLGIMQSIAGMAAILSCFNVKPAANTVRHPVVDGRSTVVQSIKGGLPLVFRPRFKVID